MAQTTKAKAKSPVASVKAKAPLKKKSDTPAPASQTAPKKATTATKPAGVATKQSGKDVKASVASTATPVKTFSAGGAKSAAKAVKTAAPVPARADAQRQVAATNGGVKSTRSVAAAIAEKAAQKISAPVTAPKMPKELAEKAAAARAAAMQEKTQDKKSVSQRHGFKTNEFVVYPAHGVGRIVGIEEQEIAGMALELFVITFDKEKLTLRVPTGKLEAVGGMRKLSDETLVKKAMDILKGRARVKRTMWSRRAQEYVAKINSGDLISIAEVVRDLYRSEAQPEQSYSERQLYEDALDRMAREIAAVEKLDERGAVQRITDVLSKSARSRRTGPDGDASDGESESRAA